jgi:4'-phosphopantetheinyl transferase EntD
MGGIDIEKIKPRIEKVRDKFINPEEDRLIGKERELEQLTLAWCAKEALYKLFGIRNLDFRENMQVEIPAQAGMKFNALISFGGKSHKYRLQSKLIGSYV